MAQVTDPVCGMTIDLQQAAGTVPDYGAVATVTYQGQTYYFCSTACKKTFEKDPAKYAGKGGQSSQKS